MKIKGIILLSLLVMLCIGGTVYSKDDKMQDNTYNLASYSAHTETRLAIDDKALYVCMKDDQGSYQLYKKALDNKEGIEKFLTIDIRGIAIYSGYMYGYVYDKKNKGKSGLYRINLKTKEKILIFSGDIKEIRVLEQEVRFRYDGMIYIYDLDKLTEIDHDYLTSETLEFESYTIKENANYYVINNLLCKDYPKEKKVRRLVEDDFLVDYDYHQMQIYDNKMYVLGKYSLNDKKRGIYMIPLDNPEEIEYIEDTMHVDRYVIYDGHLFYHDFWGNTYKYTIVNGEKVLIGDDVTLDDFILSDTGIIYYKTVYNELYERDIRDNKVSLLYRHEKQDRKLEEVLTKAYQKVNSHNAMSIKMEMTKITYDKLSDKEYKEESSSDIKIDKKQKIVQYTKRNKQYNNDEKLQIKGYLEQQWIYPEYSYQSQDYSSYRFREISESKYGYLSNYYFWLKPDLLMIYKPKLTETKNEYIVELHNSWRILWEMRASYLPFMSDRNDMNDLIIKVHIDKQYKIKKITAESKYYYKKKLKNTIVLEAKNIYLKTLELDPPKKVSNEIKQYKKATTILKNAQKEIFEKQNYTKAIEYCDSAIRVDDMNLDAYKLKAYAYYYLKEYDKALKECEYFLEHVIFEDKNNVCLLLAEIYCVKEKYVDAYRYLDKVFLWKTKFYTDEEENRFNKTIGKIYYHNDKKKDAGHYLLRYSRYNPDDIEVKILLMGVYNEIKQPRTTLIYNDKIAVDTVATSIQKRYWFYLGEAHYLLEEYDQAILCFEKCLTIDSKEIPKEQILIYIAESYCALDKYGEAEKYVKELTGSETSNWEALLLQYMVEYGLKPIQERIADAIYFDYLNLDEESTKIVNEFRSKKSITKEDITVFVDSLNRIHPGTVYYTTQDTKIDKMKVLGKDPDIEEIRFIYSLSYILADNLSSEVIQIDRLKYVYEDLMVIDLRGENKQKLEDIQALLQYFQSTNYGYLIDRQGQTTILSADGDEQKNPSYIYVWVDENTGYASELCARALKNTHDNVYIVGKETMGTGTVQEVFTDKEWGIAIYFDSAYWNIGKENYAGKPLNPDILVESNDRIDYIKAQKEHQKNQ